SGIWKMVAEALLLAKLTSFALVPMLALFTSERMPLLTNVLSACALMVMMPPVFGARSLTFQIYGVPPCALSAAPLDVNARLTNPLGITSVTMTPVAAMAPLFAKRSVRVTRLPGARPFEASALWLMLTSAAPVGVWKYMAG